MHPCCWGNILQILAPVLPILAGLAILAKKSFGGLPLFKKQSYPDSAKSCCANQKEVAPPVE